MKRRDVLKAFAAIPAAVLVGGTAAVASHAPASKFGRTLTVHFTVPKHRQHLVCNSIGRYGTLFRSDWMIHDGQADGFVEGFVRGHLHLVRIDEQSYDEWHPEFYQRIELREFLESISGVYELPPLDGYRRWCAIGSE